MEGLEQKLDRVGNDVNKIIELYDFAEKQLPYENIREPVKLNENEQRRNVVQQASYGNGINYLNGVGFWGLTTLILMNRAAAGTWADTTPMTKNPARAASWFLLGVTIAATMNALRFREAGYDRKSYALNQRVAQNEHTHAILRGISSHLATKKMSVWDANPN